MKRIRSKYVHAQFLKKNDHFKSRVYEFHARDTPWVKQLDTLVQSVPFTWPGLAKRPILLVSDKRTPLNELKL